MKTKAITVPILLLAAAFAGAAENDAVAFTRDVAPIFAESCMTCHRPGEIAPMSLLTYEESRPWARSIKREVVSGAMPPWHADPAYGESSNDRRLSEKEVQIIVDWVDAGAPRGNPEDLPELPEFLEGWQLSPVLGPPDAIFQMEEDFIVPASGPDLNPNIEVPMPLDGDKWLIAAEVRGNPRVVHHNVVSVCGADGARPQHVLFHQRRRVRRAAFELSRPECRYHRFVAHRQDRDSRHRAVGAEASLSFTLT